jgi:hypothetical protein
MLPRQGKPATSQPPHPEADFVKAWLGRHDRRRIRLRLGCFPLIVAVVLIAVWLVTENCQARRRQMPSIVMFPTQRLRLSCFTRRHMYEPASFNAFASFPEETLRYAQVCSLDPDDRRPLGGRCDSVPRPVQQRALAPGHLPGPKLSLRDRSRPAAAQFLMSWPAGLGGPIFIRPLSEFHLGDQLRNELCCYCCSRRRSRTS